ncbi:hypothetical protein MRX96_045614 [Rhipicephalus microplus]
MPLCTIKTNLLASRIPNGFNVKFAQYVASLLKKDIEKVTVIVEPASSLRKRTQDYGSQLRQFISENLAVPPKRIVITLFDLSPTDLVVA